MAKALEARQAEARRKNRGPAEGWTDKRGRRWSGWSRLTGAPKVRVGRMGGYARAKAMTPRERSLAAKKMRAAQLAANPPRGRQPQVRPGRKNLSVAPYRLLQWLKRGDGSVPTTE